MQNDENIGQDDKPAITNIHPGFIDGFDCNLPREITSHKLAEMDDCKTEMTKPQTKTQQKQFQKEIWYYQAVDFFPH